MMSKKSTILLCLILLAGGIFWYLKYYHNPAPNKPAEVLPGSKHSVVLTKDGFEPNEITIHQGDIVVFSSSAGKDFWPASDLHPTHDIYPEFDPKQPIQESQSWQFVFNKVGSWKYHDHLFSSHRGSVNVVAAGQSSVTNIDCATVGQTPQCWQKQIDAALKDKGLDAAFSLLADFYQTQPAFAQECHAYAHTLGQKAYQLFAQKKDVALSAKSSYCGYGFYHGFMETLLQTSGDIQEAKDFCAYAGKQLSGQTTDAEGACYHGIGHGAVDGSNPTAWGSAEKIMAPAMQMCQSVAGQDTSEFGKLYRCVSGAFNAIEILSGDPKYRLEQIKKDPFYICPGQPENFLEACYTNMLPAVLRFTKADFIKSAKLVQAIAEKKVNSVRPQVMLSLFHEWIRLNLNKPDYGAAEGLKICRSLNADMRLPCVEGLSGGHMKYGQPQQEYVKALAFCASKILQADERQACYAFILPRLPVWYSPEKSKEICAEAPADVKKFCGG